MCSPFAISQSSECKRETNAKYVSASRSIHIILKSVAFHPISNSQEFSLYVTGRYLPDKSVDFRSLDIIVANTHRRIEKYNKMDFQSFRKNNICNSSTIFVVCCHDANG